MSERSKFAEDCEKNEGQWHGLELPKVSLESTCIFLMFMANVLELLYDEIYTEW